MAVSPAQIDYEFMGTMMSFGSLGYKLERVKKVPKRSFQFCFLRLEHIVGCLFANVYVDITANTAYDPT
jgi:hypothetical protein